MSIKNCHNVAHFREIARKRLPSPVFNYIDGGADNELSMRRNTEAFDDYTLIPNYLVDVSKIDTSTQVFGQSIEWPVFLSPTGATRLFHHEKELGVARAAAKLGTLYSLSTLSTTRLEDVAAASEGPKMFQVYVFKDRSLTSEFVERCKASKYDVLCLTVDTPVGGNRERDKVTGMTAPPKFTLSSVFNFALHPRWLLNFALHPEFQMANVVHKVEDLSGDTSIIEYVNSQFDRSITWDDAAWLAEQWGGPFVIKGLMSVEDAVRARDIGASAIMISNHGGRQLDSTPGAVDRLPPIRDALGDDLELIVDGGIRRGTDVIKALALGATACSIGRPYLYGLAAGGQKGVERVLTLLREEIERDMTLLGVSKISDIDSRFLGPKLS